LWIGQVFCVLRQSSVLKGLSIIRWEGRGVINTERQYPLSLYGILLRLVCLFVCVKVCPPAHNYEHEAGSYGDGFT
jgi:hypothetical protein